MALSSAVFAGESGAETSGWPKGAIRLVDTGRAAQVLAAAKHLDDPYADARVGTAVAYAQLVTGDWHGAKEGFARVAPRRGPLPAGLAWRMGLTHYLRGEIEAAEEIFARGRTDAGTADEALLLSWLASARWIRGAYDEAKVLAEQADQLARQCGEARAMAGSQTVLTMIAAAVGDRCQADWHHLAAQDAAERAGDVLAQIRLRVNRSDHLIEQGMAAEALTELEAAFALTDQTGYLPQRAMALNNQGDAYASLGQYDAAVDSYLAARDAFQAMGSRMVGCPLAGLGLIYRSRGEVARARAAYEEALRQAERVGNRDRRLAALAGLARVRAADDLDQATQLADRAASLGAGPRYVEALLAQGWIARLRGVADDAARYADAAGQAARERRDEAGLAEALELAACSGPSAAPLTDAIELWTGLGNPIGVARSRMLLAAAGNDRVLAAEAGRQLHDLGVRLPWSGIADGMALVPVSGGVRIQALGMFRVLRYDVVVPTTAWQSKKARDLLKVLVARRGRPVTRDELIGLLWPEDQSDKASNRLSGLLSTLRSVLDQQQETSPLVASRSTVRLDLDVVDVDVEQFSGLASTALEAWRHRRLDAATLLTQAEAAYGGDFCEEDVFEPWAGPLREELRSLHLAVLRALATACRQRGNVDDAVRWLLVLLRHDPYDESAHLELVRTLTEAGRHGEARRHYDTYVDRMDELSIRPTPFPR